MCLNNLLCIRVVFREVGIPNSMSTTGLKIKVPAPLQTFFISISECHSLISKPFKDP